MNLDADQFCATGLVLNVNGSAPVLREPTVEFPHEDRYTSLLVGKCGTPDNIVYLATC